MYEAITIERLNYFARVMDEHSKLVEKKQKIMTKLGLKAIDYLKDRVQGGSKKLSEKECYVMSLQKSTAGLANLRRGLNPKRIS